METDRKCAALACCLHVLLQDLAAGWSASMARTMSPALRYVPLLLHQSAPTSRCLMTYCVILPEQEDGQAVPAQYLVDLRCPGGQPALGRLDVAHLGDHPSGVAALCDAVGAGSALGPLLVLQRLEVRECSWRCLLVSSCRSGHTGLSCALTCMPLHCAGV